MLKIYLTNLGKYNEGFLIGEWVTLPVDNDELDEILKRIGISDKPDKNGYYYEEYFITDYETDIDGLEVKEYSNLETLIELAEQLEELDEYQAEIVGAMLSEGYTLSEALDKMDDCYFWSDCEDMEDVARQYCETCGILEAMPEHLQNYFDFAAFGRDMSFEGHFVFTSNGNCVEIL